ncbi:hypothetical protein VTJ83DRAFT_62 [Remersonia thermophila]|uniref:Fringe-like glycosyltransferase domain-containing protein n=1 Tax=Remersonia thermophila TaxID=72144 RepID=A0ABR4DJX9_9PEZI
MGVSGPRRRWFSIRNAFARAFILAFVMVSIAGFFLQFDANVSSTLAHTATSAKDAISQQMPTVSELLSSWVDSITPSTSKPSIRPSRNMTCGADRNKLRRWQKQYGLRNTFEYLKRYVQVNRLPIPRSSITWINQTFLAGESRVMDSNWEPEDASCPDPLVVPVSQSPFPSSANASEFMFGVSTTYQRFIETRTSPINEWSYWLTNGHGKSNGGKLILKLFDATDDQLQEAQTKLTGAGIDADVYRSEPQDIMAVRYLSLVPAMFHHPARDIKKWLVLCDDDTFFPSIHALSEMLAEHDHTRPLYIGALSEDVNNVQRHGSQAFGGAGIFLSVPMAERITNRYDSCRSDQAVNEANSGWGPQGDILLRRCIYANSEVRLTLLHGLWQLDIFGDPSGFYESGLRPLSLHHYRGGIWHIAHPWHYTKVAHVCGEDCTLQRFQTADNFVISNAFSVAFYPRGIDFDLKQLEATFGPAPDDKGWNFDFAMGPRRPSLHKTGRKISWDLQEATLNEDGTVSQVYVLKHDDWRWKNPDGAPMTSRDSVIELVWMPDEEEENGV